MTRCVRTSCGAELPAGAYYCQECGAPQLEPCPVCGFRGESGVGFPLQEEECPRCGHFLVHCPECLKRYPLGSARCTNATDCAGTALQPFSQSYAFNGGNPQSTFSLSEEALREPAKGPGQFQRKWRMRVSPGTELAGIVTAHGRVFTVNLDSSRVVSVPARFEQRCIDASDAFDFSDEHSVVGRSEPLALPSTPSVQDLSIRGNRLSFMARSRPVPKYDGTEIQPPESFAFLLEASSLRSVRPSVRGRIRRAHLAADRWLLLSAGDSPGDASSYRLWSLEEDEAIAEGSLEGELHDEINLLEYRDEVYVVTSAGIEAIGLATGGRRLAAKARAGQKVLGLTVVGDRAIALVEGGAPDQFALWGLEQEATPTPVVHSLNVRIDPPLLTLEGTVFAFDKSAAKLQAFTVGANGVFANTGLDIAMPSSGHPEDLVLFRSGQSLFLVQRLQDDHGSGRVRVDQVKPKYREVGWHGAPSSELDFVYASGRLFVLDHRNGSIEALEVFAS